jgi:hypothetical protein
MLRAEEFARVKTRSKLRRGWAHDAPDGRAGRGRGRECEWKELSLGGVIFEVGRFSLCGAPPLWSCVSPHCRPRRVASRTYSVGFPRKAVLIGKKIALTRVRRGLSPRRDFQKKKDFMGFFLAFEENRFMFSTAIPPPHTQFLTILEIK